MAMDEATRSSLEILVSSNGTRRGSLVEAVDRCVTGAGARLLAEDLSAPLTDLGEITRRLDLAYAINNITVLRPTDPDVVSTATATTITDGSQNRTDGSCR